MNILVRSAILVGAVAFGALAAVAADDPIKARKELMKQVGASTKAASEMVSGKVDFDQAKAAEAMKTIAAVPDQYVKLFPDTSKTGGETEASPKIWEDMAGFVAAAEKLKVAAAQGEEAAKQGIGAYKAAFGELVKNCKSCHEAYRVKK
ncbi:MAG: cytochrome c [Pseudomonadota bacterium]|nr:cytochrome c [Pseudomonadota bacterium]